MIVTYEEKHNGNYSATIRGTSQKIKLLACIISQFMVKNSLKDAPHKKDSLDSLDRFFGHNNEVIRTMKSRPAFWKAIINTANMIVLTHCPDIGIKINEIVVNLKEVKSIPDLILSFTTSLGRRIGKSLMQIYENENNMKKLIFHKDKFCEVVIIIP